MTKSAIINPVEENQRKQALSTPHNLFLADNILDVKIDAYFCSLSLGLTNPMGQISPAFTAKMPPSIAVALAKKILEIASENKAEIAKTHAELLNEI